MPTFIDITGQKFGRLTAESYAGNGSWNVVCDCGSRKCVYRGKLVNNLTKSCGCFHKERLPYYRRKHGKTKSPTYIAWTAMRQRCLNKKNPGYSRYGEKGITICNEWMSFDAFYRDMGERPQGTSLDRIDNSKGYCKGNCRWATVKQQNRNNSRNIHVFFKQKDYVLSELCELLKIKYNLVRDRLILGWTIEDAVTRPIRGSSASIPQDHDQSRIAKSGSQ